MEITTWLAVIGSITGILSLTLYFVEIYRHRPIVSIKILKHGFKLYTLDSIGNFVVLDTIKTREDAICLINNPAAPDNLNLEITIKLLINNKGNKKATINNISYQTPQVTINIVFHERSQSGVPYAKDILIPLDVGESFMDEFNIFINKKEDMLKAICGPSKLIVVDNREISKTINLSEIQAF